MLNDQEKRGLLAIAMMAAFADGSKGDSERESIKSLAESVEAAGGISMSAVLSDVMLRRLDMASASALLTSPESRLLAYEVAVQVCDADGSRGEAESRFLDELAATLAIAPEQRAAAMREPDEMAAASLDQGTLPVLASAPLAAAASTPTEAPPDNDDMIRNYAILCGALELLPQSLASMAIIPLQMKMVYRIAKSHGETLGTTHIKDFLATLGVGLTSQYLEGMGRKLLGGLLKRSVGKWGGRLGGAATGVAMSFATTYALGHVAQQYYAGGRRMDTQTLRAAFERARGQASELQSRYMPQMQQQAANLDMGSIMKMVRGR